MLSFIEIAMEHVEDRRCLVLRFLEWGRLPSVKRIVIRKRATKFVALKKLLVFIGWNTPPMHHQPRNPRSYKCNTLWRLQSLSIGTKALYATQKIGIVLAFHDPWLNRIFKTMPSMSASSKIHKVLSEPPHATSHPWPFTSWGIDIVRPFEEATT